MDQAENEIRPLTSVRFFAAALVFLEHVRMIPGLEWFDVGHIGRVGVTIFFVLSGFIITHTYRNRNWTCEFKIHTLEFYWSRIARIYPLHWLTFLIALPLGLYSNTARVSVAEFPWFLTLTDRLWPAVTFGFQPVKAAWTLSCEALFYLVTPSILFFAAGRKNSFLRSAIVLIVCSVVVIFVALRFPELNWSAYVRLPEFLLGISGYYFAARFRTERYANALMIFGMLLLSCTFAMSSALNWMFHNFANAIGALVLIIGLGSATGKVKSALSIPRLVALGHGSFAFYLLHDPILRYSKVALNRVDVVLPFVWSVVVAVSLFAATAYCGLFCFHRFEDPVRLRLRAWRKGRIFSSAPEQSRRVLTKAVAASCDDRDA